MKVNYGVNRKVKKGRASGTIEHRNHSLELDKFPDTQDMLLHVKHNHKGWNLTGWAPAKEEQS